MLEHIFLRCRIPKMVSSIAFFLLALPIGGATFNPKSKLTGRRMLETAEQEHDVVASSADRIQWWNDLAEDAKDELVDIFDKDWFDAQNLDTQTSYTQLASSLYTLMRSSPEDAHSDDFYVGFAPILLRASFHSSASYDLPTGTGGSNGGTIFHHAELDDENNGCIDIATEKLQSHFTGHQVPLADAAVIAGAVALAVMDFPRMDLVRIQGGRADIDNVAFRDRLPSPDDDPMQHFATNYGLTLEELVALVGGAHNFGSAHGKCAGYVGQWTPTPLSWFGPSGNAPTFFTDLLREDWRWYEVCTYENNTVAYTSTEDPFASGSMPEEEDHGASSMLACPMMQSKVPMICEEQAMRGCDFPDGSYDLAESPCDISALQMRLKSDFFLKENPKLLPHAQAFASNSALLAEQFGIAYHKVTHLGLDRCGLSGHGCTEGTVCSPDCLGRSSATETCVVDHKNLESSGRGLGRVATLSFFLSLVVLLVVVLALLIMKSSYNATAISSSKDKNRVSTQTSGTNDSLTDNKSLSHEGVDETAFNEYSF